ncbi:MAG: lysophospholipid acyltransferase family protein [Gemmatimonadetes bacterium]|nr:lysophospholipid acyltransferase family protein [Gemmatimonadota bacterium]
MTAPDGPAPRAALDWRTRVVIRLGGLLVRALSATWRYRIVGTEALLARAPRTDPVVFALWHGQMLPALCGHRFRTGVLISEHKDGEVIARIVALFGMFSVRGSSSRGGARALLEASRVIRDGLDMAFTPDGPRGPRHSWAPGALLLSHRSGAPIVFIVAHAARVWRLRSWDGFEIPKPFTRVTVLYDAPRQVTAADAREAAEQTDAYAAAMLDALARVRAMGEAR